MLSLRLVSEFATAIAAAPGLKGIDVAALLASGVMIAVLLGAHVLSGELWHDALLVPTEFPPNMEIHSQAPFPAGRSSCVLIGWRVTLSVPVSICHDYFITLLPKWLMQELVHLERCRTEWDLLLAVTFSNQQENCQCWRALV